MKRFYIVIPLILLILLNACGSPGMPPEGGIYVTYTPTIQPDAMYAYESSIIFSYLNNQIESKEFTTEFDRLEHIIGANYQVVNVSFPLNPNNGTLLFHVETRCECNLNSGCCSPTRTFIVTLMAMDENPNQYVNDPIITMVPQPVNYLEVWTYDHMERNDEIYVPWTEVQRFLRGEIKGFELASQVRQTPSP